MVRKIISGGQTGADRAGLDFALCFGLEHGGHCPKGRKAEDGQISEIYHLTETASAHYSIRTCLNVKDSDATVIFVNQDKLSPGSKLTAQFSGRLKKPFIVIKDFPNIEVAAEKLTMFLDEYQPEILNIAGTRQSKESDIGEFVFNVLNRVFSNMQ